MIVCQPCVEACCHKNKHTMIDAIRSAQERVNRTNFTACRGHAGAMEATVRESKGFMALQKLCLRAGSGRGRPLVDSLRGAEKSRSVTVSQNLAAIPSRPGVRTFP
jgi:hypothetical protein